MSRNKREVSGNNQTKRNYVPQSESGDKSTGTVNVHEFSPKAFCGYESLSPGEENGEALKGLTGVLATCFSILLGMLAQMRTPRATDITVASRLLLSLMKMKHGLTFAALGALFSVHRTTSSCVFYAVPDLLHAKTEGWLVWFPREVVQETMPPSFKEKYPMCRVIIDCTEVPMEMPPEVSEQENCLSSYKSNFTLKYIVGVAPSRFISYVSEVFGGRASATYITANCGLLDLLEEDDLVLADKGFPHICYYLEFRKSASPSVGREELGAGCWRLPRPWTRVRSLHSHSLEFVEKERITVGFCGSRTKQTQCCFFVAAAQRALAFLFEWLRKQGRTDG
ncbi:hypothetical protein HPB51_022478 [Rhipicephalus microplus]|uniref:DDE Tnp4 domain-containing protein n=1 Tax=Rhipicephalus microplus TaxID=6941 RepID=A0A9J6D6V7_RHIMP|nr:hypothetical protein HPB51_022478 [Rhipicephalus microplus]